MHCFHIACSAIAAHCDYRVARHPLQDIATYWTRTRTWCQYCWAILGLAVFFLSLDTLCVYCYLSNTHGLIVSYRVIMACNCCNILLRCIKSCTLQQFEIRWQTILLDCKNCIGLTGYWVFLVLSVSWLSLLCGFVCRLVTCCTAVTSTYRIYIRVYIAHTILLFCTREPQWLTDTWLRIIVQNVVKINSITNLDLAADDCSVVTVLMACTTSAQMQYW